MAVGAATAERNTAKAAVEESTAAPRGGRLSRGRLKLGIGLTGVILFGGGAAWWATRPVVATPSEQVAQALQLLDAGKFRKAREIAKTLQEQRYRHPGFAGVLEFIQGMATFGITEAAAEPGERAQYVTTVAFLREAERLALGKDRRPEWCYALGKSLYMTNDSAAARPLLEEAYRDYERCRIDASEMLVDLYLDPGIRTPELLQQALQLNDEVIAADASDDRRRNIAYLQRAEISLAMKRFADANAFIQKLPASSDPRSPLSQVTQILQARIDMAEGRCEDAMTRLRPIAAMDQLGQTHAAEALYLLGLAAEQLATQPSGNSDGAETNGKGYLEEAIASYKKTAERYDRTPEAIAANLRLGRLYRLAKTHELALEAYGSALRSIRDPEEFRNRWISLAQFRDLILDAWNGWLEEKRYSDAIALSEMMSPLFPLEDAYEFAARVHQRWAEALEDELQRLPYSERLAATETLRKHWRQCALANVRLSKVRVSSAKYPEALWNAADFFRRGHDFERALAMINQFIATEPDRLMAAALVQRSRIELDLDQIPTALADLKQVIRTYPTDPATFTSQYLIGVCHYELDQLKEAEAAWRGILMSDQLSPSAVEWRDAQLALGQLLFEKGELKRREVSNRSVPLENAKLINAYREASQYWQEAARHLGRYLDRNPSGHGATEARYYLGKALQREAELLGRQLKIAETDNARQQIESHRDATLHKSLKQFEQLRDELLAGLNNDQIDDLQQGLLKNCFFEIAHVWFDLQDYDRAITAYNQAVNKYPQDVRTLVAYIQMGQCHHRRGRTVDARSMLQQALLLLNHQQIPTENFHVPSTNFSPEEWEAWLERARQVE